MFEAEESYHLIENDHYQDSSTSSPLSGASTLRSGKETKDRRNRERLLQGPGSEFSLTNPETDMELDYYDYNVANAGAAPGSYLGMDPAFLLWIPPLISEDSEDPSADRPDCFQGTTSPALFSLPESTEGASLTPAEYRRMRHLAGAEEARSGFEQNRQDSTSSSSSSKNDSSSGGSAMSEDSIAESRARLNERLLPIHRILEDSRTRVSEESLCSQLAVERTQCVIPNRLHAGKSDLLCQEQEAARTSSRQGSLVNINDGVASRSVEDKSEKSTKQPAKGQPEDRVSSKSYANQRTKDTQEDRKRYLKDENTSKFSGKPTSSKPADGNPPERFDKGLRAAKDDPRSDVLLTNLSLTPGKYRDFTQFTQPRESNKQPSDCTNIPMIEFSGPRLSSPVATQKLTTDNLNISLSRKEIQSPDYGVETDMKTEPRETFYDLIRENEDGIKFADDDDEYIDNRANL